MTASVRGRRHPQPKGLHLLPVPPATELHPTRLDGIEDGGGGMGDGGSGLLGCWPGDGLHGIAVHPHVATRIHTLPPQRAQVLSQGDRRSNESVHRHHLYHRLVRVLVALVGRTRS